MDDAKKLVVFFSHTGENYNVGNIDEGNTEIIANMISDAVGAKKFQIMPVNVYPHKSYEECCEVAKREKHEHARPAFQGNIDIKDFDVIFVGYPNWWSDLPMVMYTFFERHNWHGKTVIPFITHEGSGMGNTDHKVQVACHGAHTLVGQGLAIEGKVAQKDHATARKEVNTWLKGLGFKLKNE